MITIAVLSVRIYKSLFMKHGVIGIIQKKGYGNNVNQSILALMWLSEIENGIPNFRWKLGVGGEI